MVRPFASESTSRTIVSTLIFSRPAKQEVRDFARSTGRLAKTDALDAEVNARFFQAVQPEPLPDEQAQALEAILTRRRQIVGMITPETNRRGSASSVVRPRIEAHLRG